MPGAKPRVESSIRISSGVDSVQKFPSLGNALPLISYKRSSHAPLAGGITKIVSDAGLGYTFRMGTWAASDLIPEIYTSRRVTHESATAVFSDQKFPALQQELDGRICCSEKT